MDLSTIIEEIRKTEVSKPVPGETIGKDVFTKACEEAIASPKGLVIAAITSNTQASFESDQTPYGAGKTTLAMHLSYHFNHFDPETKRYYDSALDKDDIKNWGTTNDNMWYYPSRILKSMDKAVAEHRRLLSGVWEDVQYTAGAQTGLPAAIEELVGDLTTDRPEIGVLFLTMPNVMGVAAAIRNLIQFELIVHSRGRFEVQHVNYRKNFRNPKKDYMHLEYVPGQGRDEKEQVDFGPLPLVEQRWYDDWRAEQKSYKRKRTIATLERFERVTRPGESIEPTSQVQASPQPRTVKRGWGE